eukprot:CAMPEP_0181306314 /NCGR_PEP_ID=MMETSP1101-20121128/10229_1 /TAXON_ID=46948 /ORGANISM="Rhodomonas abbreviata, Strain Caron Lab Isolate" /LENGTH=336 /DNA_ID=CAMNT_0023412353 /DNA_START=84 /DNA_END=1091 /DNA_ORIENTATION=-
MPAPPPPSAMCDTTRHEPLEVFKKCQGTWEVSTKEYKLVQKIGEGAYGIIYKGTLRGETVAAKMLKEDKEHGICHTSDEQGYKDLIMELDILLSIGTHPNLVQFMGACIEDRGNPIVFEEFVNGPSLAQYFQLKVEHSGFVFKPPRAMAYGWIMDMLRALDFLHNRDPVIIHRDMKPGNLLLSRDLSILKLADFGMGKVVRRDQLDHANHRGHTGTVAYMAPEVFNKIQSHYTEKADIYSAAVIMWCICSGQGPMLSKAARTHPHNITVRPDLSQIGWKELEEVVNTAWHPIPEQRPSAADLLATLSRLPGKPSLEAPPMPKAAGAASNDGGEHRG